MPKSNIPKPRRLKIFRVLRAFFKQGKSIQRLEQLLQARERISEMRLGVLSDLATGLIHPRTGLFAGHSAAPQAVGHAVRALVQQLEQENTKLRKRCGLDPRQPRYAWVTTQGRGCVVVAYGEAGIQFYGTEGEPEIDKTVVTPFRDYQTAEAWARDLVLI